MSLRTAIDPIDATPIKRIFLSIIADYDLKSSLCELIDNSIDAWRAAARTDALEIKLDLDTFQKTIEISDNAGGVKQKDLNVLVSPGAASAATNITDSIGVFGVGSKRSVVALAERIRITTRFGTEDTFRLEIDDEWIHDETSEWNVPAYKVDNISSNATEIELTKLRVPLEDADIADLKEHLSATYAMFLENENIWLVVNGTRIEPKFFNQWAFPTEYPPKSTIRSLADGTNGRAEFRITHGLTYEELTLSGNHGVFVYCNRRLIGRALLEPELGFVSGQAGKPHHDMNLARIIVEFSGDADNMPWTSKKDALNYNHPSFQNARSDITTVVTNCAKWSKVLKPDAATKVVPFKEGEVIEERLPARDRIKPSRLPTPPKSRRDYKEDIASANRSTAAEKPWTKGLYESIIAEQLISRSRSLSQRNRISWIILDSIVEIGCKEYRVREMGATLSAASVKKLTRESLHNEVSKHLMVGDSIWDRLEYNYEIRNSFIHEKSGVTIPDGDVDQFRHDVERFLAQGFGLRFPKS